MFYLFIFVVNFIAGRHFPSLLQSFPFSPPYIGQNSFFCLFLIGYFFSLSSVAPFHFCVHFFLYIFILCYSFKHGGNSLFCSSCSLSKERQERFAPVALHKRMKAGRAKERRALFKSGHYRENLKFVRFTLLLPYLCTINKRVNRSRHSLLKERKEQFAL